MESNVPDRYGITECEADVRKWPDVQRSDGYSSLFSGEALLVFAVEKICEPSWAIVSRRENYTHSLLYLHGRVSNVAS